MAAFSRRRGRRLAMVGLALLAGSCTDRDAGRAPASSQSSAATAPVAVVDGLAGPEAVRYDPDQDVYFVSNVNGDPAGDANGFISRVGPDGAVLAREFMTGTERSPLHGPRGLWLAGDTLWAADAGGLHAFDRRGGAHLGFVDFSAHEPGFLNDIASGPDGALYVTDTDRSRVFRLAAGEVTVAVDDRALCGPNGITWDARGGRFLLASWDRGPSVQAWRPGTRTIEAVGSPGPGGFDGIELWGDRILVASQSDSTLRELGAGGEGTMLRLPGAPADIGIDMRRGRVAIPMMDRNQVEIRSLPPRSP